MPGRLLMDVKDPRGPVGLKRDGSHLSQLYDEPDAKRLAIASAASAPHVNGTTTDAPPVNGVNGELVARNVAARDGAIEASYDGQPPEIEKFRDTLVPFGRMLERMAQQTYFDLSELLEALADMRVPQPQMANGIGGQSPPDKSAVSVDKKLRLLNFAQMHKDRFIKALVLSDWARNMDDMAKLIDVSMFLRKYDWSTASAADSILRMKENMVGAKMPNPNIEGALELLSTGQAPWMPDMDYIPPKPLKATELLDTLRDMNFALSIRLNLHEELPSHFKEYTIANGRVTFTVPDEFEVDLAIADRDADSRFYFIDLRLIFSPAVSIHRDRLRNSLEAQVNTALESSGLQGCYEYLHDFVLTHKLNIIRCQALELARGKWIDHIEVQSIHRSVIVQYWKDLPGGRNWIEFGVLSGRTEDVSVSQKNPSRLSCRWFRRGQEILEHQLRFDFATLSVERMLEEVIATHISGRLTVITEAIERHTKSSTCFRQELETSMTSPSDCVLRASLAPIKADLEIRIDPVRGLFSASPGTTSNSDLERKINNDPHADVPLLIRNSLCRGVAHRVVDLAESLNFARLAIDVRPRTVSPFPVEPIVHRSFRFSNDTNSTNPQQPQYALTAAIDLQTGLSWYVSHIAHTHDASLIQSVFPLQDAGSSVSLDRATVLSVQERAARIISRNTLGDEFKRRKLPYRVIHSDQQSKAGGCAMDTVYLKVADIASPWKKLAKHSPQSTPFVEMGAMSYRSTSTSQVEYIFRTRLRNHATSKLLQHLRRSHSIDIDADGHLLLGMRASLGTPVLPLLCEHLDGVAKLCAFVRVIGNYHYGLVSATLEEICFKYSSSWTCTVTISESSSGPLIRFGSAQEGQTAEQNPHNRIRQHLEDMLLQHHWLNEIDGSEVKAFATFCAILRATLPVVDLMQKFVETEPQCTALLMCRSPTTYKLSFRPPLPGISFQVSGRQKNGELYWLVKLVEVKSFTEKARAQISSLWREKGNGWRGLRTAAIADVTGVGDLLQRINTLMRQSEGDEPVIDAKAGAHAPAHSGKTASEAVVLD